MKKYDKSYYAGIVVLIAAILAGILLGQARKPALPETLDASLDAAGYAKYLQDGAGVLDEAQEKTLRAYNANWDYRYNSVTAVVTADTARGANLEELSFDLAGDMGLGEGDAILLIAVDDGEYYFNYGNDFATIVTSSVMNDLSAELERQGQAGENIVAFYAALDGVYRDNFGLGNAEQRSAGAGGAATVIVLLLILVLFLLALDRARFTSYRARYYGVASPAVVFRPIFFWHRPGSAWYRRRWTPPPPPPPPASSGGRPGSGFGGAGARPSRGGGTFGGRPSGTGTRGGFGGSFGGSRGGGFSGGHRGGGFSGGSRGGGFGGRR